MSDYRVLENVLLKCPICGKEHIVEKRSRQSHALVKETQVSFSQVYYCCTSSDSAECEFAPGSIMDENLLRARNAYRKQKKLLTSDEIVEIRKYYGLTQGELSALLGWGDVTIARYESKNIQDETYDRYLRMIRENPSFALESLKEHRDRFSEEKYCFLKKQLLSKVADVGLSYLRKQDVLAQYSLYDEPSAFNGFKLIDLDKISAMMAYFANKFHHIYNVRLMKLLWYADALSFFRNRCSVSGLVYRREQSGALPVASNDLLYLPGIQVIEEELGDLITYRVSSKSFNSDCLSSDELCVLEDVYKRFAEESTSQLVQRICNEPAYCETQMHQEMSFEFCNNLKAFQS